MGGQAGGRGYLIQALVSVLDALSQDHEWSAIQLEPNVATDKVDILWEYPSHKKAVQVKSSQNQISVPDVKAWAAELESSIVADEYEISLIGPVSQGVIDLGAHGKVQIPIPRSLDLDGFIHQAAHQLDRYLQSLKLGIQSPSTREMVVNALVARLSTFATNGTSLNRIGFNNLLMSWIGGVAEVGVIHSQVDIPIKSNSRLKAEDAEVLKRLASAHQNILMIVRNDSFAGMVVLIDNKPLADFMDTDGCVKYYEAVQRLRHRGFLTNPRGDGKLFSLSGDGREYIKHLERTCQMCEKPKFNKEKDPTQPPIWVCDNHRCLGSSWHKSSKCSKCGKRPYKILSQGTGFTTFLCDDGHEFTELPRRG